MSLQLPISSTTSFLLTSQDPRLTVNISIIPGEYTIFQSCLYCIISALSLTLNILVIWAMWPQVIKSLGVPIYVVSLLSAALLESVSLPFGVACLLGSFSVGSMACSIICLIPTIAQRVATIFVVWIFAVRYVAVAHPLGYSRICKVWIYGLSSIFMWLIPILISILEQMIIRVNTKVWFPNYKVDQDGALIDLLCSFFFCLLPLILLSTFCILITCALKKSPTVCIKQRRRISTLLMLVVIGFGVFFCPMHGILVYQNILLLLGHSSTQLEIQFLLPYQLMFALNILSVVLSPLFYAYTSSGVKKRLVSLIKKAPP